MDTFIKLEGGSPTTLDIFGGSVYHFKIATFIEPEVATRGVL